MESTYRVPSVDVGYLSRWSPQRFAVLGLAILTVLILVSPLEYDYSVVTTGAVLYAVAAYVCFFAGCQLAIRAAGHASDASPKPIGMSADRFINIAALIGFVGIALRIYDRVFLRGFRIEGTYSETRESMDTTVSALGYMGGLFFSFGTIALMLVWLSSSQRRRPAMLIFAGLLALYPAIEGLLQGGRSMLINTAFTLFFLARSTNALGWLVKSRVALAVAAVGMIAFLQLIYEIRSLEIADELVNISEFYRLSGVAEYARAFQWVTSAIGASGGSGLWAGILKVWLHSTQYLTHSWVVFCINYEQFADVHGWGRFLLNMPLRALAPLLGEGLIYNSLLYGQVEGIFSTALTSLYYDFGSVGPLMAGVFGFLATLIHRRTIELPERWLPLHAYICFACVSAPVENTLLLGLGSFAVWAFIAYVPLHFVLSILGAESAVPEEEKHSLDAVSTQPPAS